MKNLLRLEELAQFALCLAALIAFDVPWWAYLLLALGPDVGMLGYLVSSRVGSISYNLLHHKMIAVLIFALGILLIPEGTPFEDQNTSFYCIIFSTILYGHSSMDRIFDYGLKFGDNFHHTHLGWIERKESGE